MSWWEHLEVEVRWGARGVAAGGAGAWDLDVWDGPGTWSGWEPSWAVLDDCWISNLTVTRGRAKATERFSAGTLSMTLVAAQRDQSRIWSWLLDQPTIGDELSIRARVRDGGDWWPLFRGSITALSDGFELDGRLAVSVAGIDAMAEIAAVDLPEVDPPVGAGERSDQRISRILDLIGFPVERRRLDVGVVTVQSTNLARNLLDEAQVTAESEVGDLWVDAEGMVIFRNRQWWLTDPRTTSSRVTYSNVPGSGHCPAVFRTALDLSDLENRVSMARAGGTALTVIDHASRARFGLRTFTRFDLVCEFDVDVQIAASARLAENRQRTRRVEQLSVKPEAAVIVGVPAAVAWGPVLDLRLGDAATVEWLAGGADEPDSRLMHVQGWTHTIDAAGGWVTDLQVWDRPGYTPVSGWDIALWDGSEWAA